MIIIIKISTKEKDGLEFEVDVSFVRKCQEIENNFKLQIRRQFNFYHESFIRFRFGQLI